MIKIFGKKFAEMRDIEDAKKAILEEVGERLKGISRTVTDKAGQLSYRIDQSNAGSNRAFREHRANIDGIEKYLSAFADEVFLHLPAKKSTAPLEYHHKRVAKTLEAKPVEQETEQANHEA